MAFNYLTNEVAKEKASKLNLEVVTPDEYTLVVDIDSGFIPSRMIELTNKIGEHYPVKSQAITVSKSGNYHYYVKFEKPMTNMEKIALQAILGSDPIKELLSFVRAKEGGLGEPSLMFEKKEWVSGLEELLNA